MTERIVSILLSSFWQILLPGLITTIPLTVLSFSIGLMIALVTAIVQVADIRGLKQVARFYVWVIRGTPLLVQLYIIFYGLPGLGILLDAFPAAVIAFSINVGAYTSETIRAAILAVPAGQTEAGYCVGLNYVQIMRRIVLPQALKIAFPSLFNSLIGLTKDTSLAANITVLEMFMATQRIAARTYEPFALYCEVAVIYLMMCTILTKLQKYGEYKLTHGRSHGNDRFLQKNSAGKAEV
ncbi:MAG: amino acid ABC transporter permease [bacterium]|nr:amino acid ABC transporter permease [bacterium]